MKRQILFGTFVLCLMGLGFSACARKHKVVPPPAAASTNLPPAVQPQAAPAAKRPPAAQPSRLDYVKK